MSRPPPQFVRAEAPLTGRSHKPIQSKQLPRPGLASRSPAGEGHQIFEDPMFMKAFQEELSIVDGSLPGFLIGNEAGTASRNKAKRAARPDEVELEQNGVVAGPFDYSGNVQKVVNVVVADARRDDSGVVDTATADIGSQTYLMDSHRGRLQDGEAWGQNPSSSFWDRCVNGDRRPETASHLGLGGRPDCL